MNQQDMSFGNLDKVKENKFAPIPAGTYTLRAIDIEMRDTTSGKGINVEFVVVGGEFDNKKIFEFYNVIHTEKQQTVEIALSNIKGWIQACGGEASGELKWSMIQQLEGKTFRAKVGIKVDKKGVYDDQNSIKRFLKPEMGMSTAAPSSSNTAPPAQSAASEARPWEK